ncbi:hypothetical protein VNI00_008191 [Paramarasmius palmivorus]|uniref:Uncharacterized protein n=1 Tax=Paramarasmius palmivorus TaxID=297713 RepID=A0AAW0CXB0_9AGAR
MVRTRAQALLQSLQIPPTRFNTPTADSSSPLTELPSSSQRSNSAPPLQSVVDTPPPPPSMPSTPASQQEHTAGFTPLQLAQYKEFTAWQSDWKTHFRENLVINHEILSYCPNSPPSNVTVWKWPAREVDGRIIPVPPTEIKKYLEDHDINTPRCAHDVPMIVIEVSVHNPNRGIAGTIGFICGKENPLPEEPSCKWLMRVTQWVAVHGPQAVLGLYGPKGPDGTRIITATRAGPKPGVASPPRQLSLPPLTYSTNPVLSSRTVGNSPSQSLPLLSPSSRRSSVPPAASTPSPRKSRLTRAFLAHQTQLPDSSPLPNPSQIWPLRVQTTIVTPQKSSEVASSHSAQPSPSSISPARQNKGKGKQLHSSLPSIPSPPTLPSPIVVPVIGPFDGPTAIQTLDSVVAGCPAVKSAVQVQEIIDVSSGDEDAPSSSKAPKPVVIEVFSSDEEEARKTRKARASAKRRRADNTDAESSGLVVNKKPRVVDLTTTTPEPEAGPSSRPPTQQGPEEEILMAGPLRQLGYTPLPTRGPRYINTLNGNPVSYDRVNDLLHKHFLDHLLRASTYNGMTATQWNLFIAPFTTCPDCRNIYFTPNGISHIGCPRRD